MRDSIILLAQDNDAIVNAFERDIQTARILSAQVTFPIDAA